MKTNTAKKSVMIMVNIFLFITVLVKINNIKGITSNINIEK
jgi:hypothetical protein